MFPVSPVISALLLLLIVIARTGLMGRIGPIEPSAPESFALASRTDPNQISAMESHEVLREVLEKCNAKQVASDMGLSLSLIYKWAEPAEMHGSGTANPLDRIEALVRCSGDERLVQWICERAGGTYLGERSGGAPSRFSRLNRYGTSHSPFDSMAATTKP